jgi:hypothetical protein
LAQLNGLAAPFLHQHISCGAGGACSGGGGSGGGSADEPVSKTLDALDALLELVLLLPDVLTWYHNAAFARAAAEAALPWRRSSTTAPRSGMLWRGMSRRWTC